jgi:hypothetical protein
MSRIAKILGKTSDRRELKNAHSATPETTFFLDLRQFLILHGQYPTNHPTSTYEVIHGNTPQTVHVHLLTGYCFPVGSPTHLPEEAKSLLEMKTQNQGFQTQHRVTSSSKRNDFLTS